MALVSGQPKIRFSTYDPNGMSGISWLPKMMLIEKTWGTQTSNDDFWVAPAGIFVSRALGVCADAGDAATQVSLGQDGAPHSIIAYTDFSVETVGNSKVFTAGLYLNAGDTLRVTVGGTPVAGKARFMVEYYETAEMFGAGFNVSI